MTDEPQEESQPEITVEQLAAWCLDADEKQLNMISNLIKVRRQAIREMKTAVKNYTLYVGDRVYLTNVSPKKLNGRTGTITEIKGYGEFKVKLDSPTGNWIEPIVQGYQLEPYNL